MELRFGRDELSRLETDRLFTGGLPPAVVTAYRRRIQLLRAIPDGRELPLWRCLHYLRDDPVAGQDSILLVDTWRISLVLTRAIPRSSAEITAVVQPRPTIRRRT